MSRAERSDLPLCVGLSRGLLRNGLTTEATFSVLKRRPGVALAVLPRLFGGRGRVARWIAGRVDTVSPAWDEGVLDRVRAARERGRSVILAAHEPRELVEALGPTALEPFDHVVSADGAGAMGRVLADRFGEGGFDFLGGPADRNALKPFARRVEGPPSIPGAGWRAVPRAIRVHQWMKNVLVFLPVLAGQRFGEIPVLLQALGAFAAFSMAASSVYVINDLLDLPDDRVHPRKRTRPFAAGTLPLSWAPWLVFVLLAGSIAVASLLPPLFQIVLAGYLTLTFAYSLKLKGTLLIDVVTLAGLYTIRIIAGAAATGIEPSVWLLGFSLFFFLSLALVKRYAELHGRRAAVGASGEESLPGRGYQERDLPVLIALGVGTGCVAVLILALYVISDEFARHYRYPILLWQLCPLLLYWIGRAWIVVARDEMTDDPIVWAVRDQLSRWVGIAALVILVLAR